MTRGSREREREKRDARLQHMQDQVSTGALVIRQMTASEHAACDREREERHASMTPAQRARSEALLRERRRRAAFFAALATDADRER